MFKSKRFYISGFILSITLSILNIYHLKHASAQDNIGPTDSTSRTEANKNEITTEPAPQSDSIDNQASSKDGQALTIPLTTENQTSTGTLPKNDLNQRADGNESGKAGSKKSQESTPNDEDESIMTEKTKEQTSWTDKIKLKGDLRYRVELIDQQEKEFRYRHRIRARVGMIADVIDDLQATVQLGTGESDDPVSNNQSLTKAFSSKPLWLDLAFFDWHPNCLAGTHIVGGKMHNPYYTVGKTELLWDPDLNPEGLALTYQNTFGWIEPFLNGSVLLIQERKEDDESWLIGAQGGARFNPLENTLYILLGGGYFDYVNVKNKEPFWDPEDSFGNSIIATDDSDGDGEMDSEFRYRYDYKLLNGFIELGGTIASLPWAVFADYVVNLKAEADDTGWLFGISVGKTKEAFDTYFRYIYRRVQRDATIGILTDSDFVGGGTDGKGHEFNLGFQLSKTVTTFVSYFYNQKHLDDSIDFHRAQFDLKLKF